MSLSNPRTPPNHLFFPDRMLLPLCSNSACARWNVLRQDGVWMIWMVQIFRHLAWHGGSKGLSGLDWFGFDWNPKNPTAAHHFPHVHCHFLLYPCIPSNFGQPMSSMTCSDYRLLQRLAGSASFMSRNGMTCGITSSPKQNQRHGTVEQNIVTEPWWVLTLRLYKTIQVGAWWRTMWSTGMYVSVEINCFAAVKNSLYPSSLSIHKKWEYFFMQNAVLHLILPILAKVDSGCGCKIKASLKDHATAHGSCCPKISQTHRCQT